MYVEQVKSWQDNFLQANGGVAQELALSQRREKEKEKELKQVRKELQRKDAALAETAALLVLRKKAEAILGIPGRGSLTSTANRAIIIELVEEAVANGASQKLACAEIGISPRTLQRWCKDGAPTEDQRPLVERPAPANKLTEEECQAILDTMHQPEFQSLEKKW